MDPQRGDERGDLDTVEDITEMVRRFYADVENDDLLGPMFNDVAQVDWSEHLPKLTAFWCRALLSLPGYEGNPYRSHLETDAKEPFTRAHFEHWLVLFHRTLDGGWSGPNVDQAKAFACKVGMVHSRAIVGDAVLCTELNFDVDVDLDVVVGDRQKETSR